MTATKIKTLVGNTVRYRYSNYIFREGIVIEDAGEKVRVHWNKEFFKNPNTSRLIGLQTWVSRSLLLASDWGYGKTIEPISSPVPECPEGVNYQSHLAACNCD